jgi:hypothetical protein
LLPALTNTVVLGSKSHGIHVVHICLPSCQICAGSQQHSDSWFRVSQDL